MSIQVGIMAAHSCFQAVPMAVVRKVQTPEKKTRSIICSYSEVRLSSYVLGDLYL